MVFILDIGFEESEVVDNFNLLFVLFDLVYIMYIFGLMGKLKGVMIEYKSILCFVKNVGYVFVIEEDCMV